jgi:serine/threonine protein kinase
MNRAILSTATLAAGSDKGASVSEIIESWRRGEAPDARIALSKNPPLQGNKSVVLGLAYEEYCLRTEAGEELPTSNFCDNFPSVRHSLQRLLEVHHYLRTEASDDAPDKRISWPQRGDDLLGFRIIEELGRGAIGRVFLAKQPALGNRLVVLKLSFGGSQEAQILGRLAHHNIVPVFSVQEVPATGLVAVCMPYLGSATLCDVLDRAFAVQTQAPLARVILEAARDDRPQSAGIVEVQATDRFLAKASYIDGVLHLGKQLAGALAFSHARGVMHRDLKPSNVLVGSGGKPMLLDFNLSFDPQASEMRVGGTLGYAAPEHLQVLLQSGAYAPSVDPRSDLFSLGVILYELLTGELPFAAVPKSANKSRLLESMLASQAAGPCPLRQRNPLVDRFAAKTIERCLRFNPDRRQQTAEQLAAALSRSLSPLRRLVRWSRSARRSLSLAAMLLIGTMLGIGGYLLAREPYSIREYRQGLQELRIAKYQTAIVHFNHALEANPNAAALLFARGQARQQLGDYPLAIVDYRAASATCQAGMIQGSLAYCFAKNRAHLEAIDCGLRAIDCGAATAEVQNNLGYCFWKLDKLRAAREHLDAALALDPHLQAAYYNRAKVTLRSVLKDGGAPTSGIADIEQAIKLGPATSDLYFDAAYLHALDAGDPRHKEQATRYLKKAIESGWSADAIRRDPVLSAYSPALESVGQSHGPSTKVDASHSSFLVPAD